MSGTRTEANRKEYPRLTALNWLYSLFAASAVTLLVFTAWFTGVRISDNGMAPTLREGDVVLFDRLAKYLSTPKRGDAYAFKSGGTAVGRIVGLPGDRVAMRGGTVYINGFRLDESRYAALSGWDMEEIRLGQGQFFILPDDRGHAVLMPGLMTVSFDRLIGRAAVRVSPITSVSIFVNG